MATTEKEIYDEMGAIGMTGVSGFVEELFESPKTVFWYGRFIKSMSSRRITDLTGLDSRLNFSIRVNARA